MIDDWLDAVREAERRIDHGWYAALCVIVFRGFLGGLAAASGSGSFWSQLPYLSAVLVLAVGVAKKSRVAAALLLLQEVWVDGGLAWKERSVFIGLMTLGFGYFYASGLLGTIRFHQLQGQRPGNPTGSPTAPIARAGA